MNGDQHISLSQSMINICRVYVWPILYKTILKKVNQTLSQIPMKIPFPASRFGHYEGGSVE